MNDRVRTLSLRVRAPRTDADQKAAATRFVSEVLTRVSDRLRGSHADHVVFVRTLKLDLRMIERALSITSEVDAVASRIEAHVEQLIADAARVTPSPDDEIAVFPSVAAWRAAYVVADPASRGCWYFQDLVTSDDPSAMVGMPDARLARATIAEVCKHTSSFERALARLDTTKLVAWVRTLRAIDEAVRGERPTEHADEPFHPRTDRLVAEVLRAARALAGESAAPDTTATDRVTDDRQDAAEKDERTGGERTTDDAQPTGAPPSAERERDRSPRARSAGPERAFTTAPTRIGRAAYLVSLWLEIDVGQALFLAGLREGTWFAHALASAAGLASPEGEALCSAVGGEAAHSPLPEIAPSKIDEVSTRVLETWMRSAAARRLDVDLTLTVERWSDRRLLVVRGARCAAPIGALAADTIEEATTSLRKLIGIVPPSATLRGSRALAELDRKRRVLPTVVDGVSTGGDAATLLVATVAGAALELYALRSGLAGHAIAPSFAVDGNVVEDAELVIVELDASAIDVALRVAGLDGSPGFMPWRNKQFEIDFTGLEIW